MTGALTASEDSVRDHRYQTDAESFIANQAAPETLLPDNEPRTAMMFGNPDDDELFGYYGGKLHPFVSLRGEWTDNLYNLNVDETDSFQSSTAPGIWFSVPRAEKPPARLSPYNVAIGGSRYSLPDRGTFDRFQAYLLGGLDYRTYSADPELNYTAWNLEGTFQYNLPVGLSFRIMDRFIRDRDQIDIGSFLPGDFTLEQSLPRVTSTPSRIREYLTNQAYAALNFDTGHRVSLLLDYTNFYVEYDEPVNNRLNRTDDRYGLSLSYTYSPKTSVFAEYARAVVRYREETGNDSDNIFVYAGIDWKGSARTSLMAKGGYQVQKYEHSDSGESGTFTMEARFNYTVTEKTKISLSVYKALEESNSLAHRGVDTVAARFRYDQQVSNNIRAFCDFRYEFSDYAGLSRAGDALLPATARRDTSLTVQPGIQYSFRDWLAAELAYSFESRNSNENLYDYTTQTVRISLNIAF